VASDIEIARRVALQPIAEIAARAGIQDAALLPYGRHKAKIDTAFIDTLRDRPDGALVLVSGISPTAAGEGKTTTTIGLGDALHAIGRPAMVCLREPSLGPCFGQKGGATGGGWAQVAPMDEINLHFTGDFHAVTAANNLLAALIDNHLHWGNALGLDPRRITWRRCLDMNDRVLREIVTGLGFLNGVVREAGFDITVASEVMAVLCLARDRDDLQARLGRMIVGTGRDGAVRAGQLGAVGAMTALLRDALMPNLVQTLAGSPALVHGGPFANIAHGCNSVIATQLGLKLAEIVVTEAGFGADLGGEKFIDIKCRSAGLVPSCVVIVATVRALKLHGAVAKAAVDREDVAAVRRGVANLRRHLENVAKFGLPAVVALNRFTSDTEAEIAAVREAVGALAPVVLCTHWADGPPGAMELARHVAELCARPKPALRFLYPAEMMLADKITTIAREIYRAGDIVIPASVAKRLAQWEAEGFGHLPVCIAKTQYSFSDDPTLHGAPTGHTFTVREVRRSAGAGFVVALAGDIRTLPGLPRAPTAEQIRVLSDGQIDGLF
jgi:formate--tetrahydrofolate ligase